MDGLSKGELKALIEPRTGPCVTLYMPTHEAGADIQQDPIRFKNLLREAEDRLREKNLKQPQIDEILGQAHRLLDLDRLFWRSPKESFALFAAPGFFKYYHLPLKLHELVHVEGRFQTKPLLRLLSSNARFFVLALSQDDVRLLEATQYSVRQVDLKGAPDNMAEALQIDELGHPPKMRVGVSHADSIPSRQNAYFNQSSGVDPSDVKREDLKEYFRIIDRALHDYIGDDTAPLVLAGVDYLIGTFRDVTSNQHVMPVGIVGNQELASNDELHDRAWPIAREYLLTGEREAVARFQNLTGSTKSSIDVREIVSAAHQGRVDTLFAADGIEVWGSYDADSDQTTIEQVETTQNTDLLDLAATQTFQTGGRVYVVEPSAVPGGESIAAILRF